MTVRVDVKKWGKKNRHYIAAWVTMGLVLLVLVIKELGIYTLLLIGPFLPYLWLVLAKLRREMKE
ncbi:MAG: hypothetical protein QXT22_01755 [Candidatus Hadarchaeales archaeon]